MTNNFSVVKLNAQSQKIILVRMKPRRAVEYSLALDSGNVYEMTFPYDSVCGVTVNGTALTEVVGTPANATQYSFDKTTKLLQIYLASALVDYQTINTAIMVDYYLYYTNETGRIFYSDPEDDTSDEVFYEPRIKNDPAFSVSQDNIINGILSVSNLSLILKNQDNDFQQYLTDYDSFSRCEFKSWHCLNTLTNIQKLFFGSVVSISLSSLEVSLSVDNLFGLFENTYISNGTLKASTYENTNFTVSNENRKKFILKLYGRVSQSGQSKVLDFESGEYVPWGLSEIQQYYRFDKIHEAVNVSYNTTVSKTNNRRWACCIDSQASSDLSETVSGKTTVAFGGVNLYRVNVADASLYLPGDNVILDMAGTPKANSVVSRDTGNNRIFLNNSNFSNGDTIFRPSISFVQWRVTGPDQGRFSLVYLEDYTIDVVDGVRCILFTDNFEDNYILAATDQVNGILPDDIVEFRAWNNDDLNHSIVLQEVVESLGLTINQDSFDDAALEDIETNFTLPYWGSDDMPSVREVIQNLMASTFGYISINNDFEIEYHLLGRPSPTESITENEFIKGSLRQEIDYRDIYTNLEFTNVHELSVFNDPRLTGRVTISERQEYFYDRGRFYHNLNKSKSLKYVIKDIYNTGMGHIISFALGNRKLTITLDTKGFNFESIVGDDYSIESSKIVGDDGVKDIKILSIDKTPTQTTISGIDLLGLDE